MKKKNLSFKPERNHFEYGEDSYFTNSLDNNIAKIVAYQFASPREKNLRQKMPIRPIIIAKITMNKKMQKS